MSKRSPLVLNAGQQQQLQSADYADIGVPYMMHKNRLINGDFDVWQRGASFSTTIAGYYSDRWVVSGDGTASTGTISQQAFTAGQTAVPDNPAYYHEIAVTAAGTTQSFYHLAQRIEGSQTFQGQQVTLSFWAKADSARTIGWYWTQSFGSGGSASVTTNFASSIALTTSWQKFTVTATLGSTSGKTIGAGDYLEIGFILPINTTFTFDLSHVQFEAGGNATQFEHRHLGHETLLCQRYYCTGGAGLPAGIVSTAAINGELSFSVPMRVPPTATLNTTTPSISVPGISSYTASGGTGGWSTAPTGAQKGGICFIAGFTIPSGNIGKLAFISGDYFNLSAEL